MLLRPAMIHVLAIALATSPLMAQQPQSPSDEWHTFVERLPPGTPVTVHLKSGERVEGHLVEVTPDTLHLNPTTRIAVPVRVFAFDAIQSIERKKEGMSPGAKVAIWTAIITGALIGVVVALLPKT